MKDLGELHFILGLQVKRERTTRTLHLSQKQYIDSTSSDSPTSMFNFNSADIKAMDALDKAISSLETTLADLKAARSALQVANNPTSGSKFNLGGPLAR